MYLATFSIVGLPRGTRFAFGNRAFRSWMSCDCVSRTMIVTMPLSLEATSNAPSAQRPVP